MFKLAMIQMFVVGGEKHRNLNHAEEMVRKAHKEGAEIAVLPEVLDLGWTHPASQTGAGEIPVGEACQRLCHAAARNGIYLCAGLTEKDNNKIYNSAVIIDKKGTVILKHRKLNELDIGHDYYAQGDRLNVCHTDLGTLGLHICADATAEGEVLSRALGYMGADIILSPSAWAVKPDHDNLSEPYGKLWKDAYIPVAKKFSIWIIGNSNVGQIIDGPWKGWNCIGCSLAIDPKGNIAAFGPYGADAETIIYVDIELVKRPARGTQWYGR